MSNYLAISTEVKRNIFFNGQIYDAFVFIIRIIGKGNKEVILIDNYVNINIINILCKKNKGVDIVIATAGKGENNKRYKQLQFSIPPIISKKYY